MITPRQEKKGSPGVVADMGRHIKCMKGDCDDLHKRSGNDVPCS